MKSGIGFFGGTVLAGIFLFWLACIHWTPYGQVGIMRNVVNGEVMIDHAGWNFSPPWIFAAKLESRPTRVCIATAGRGFNCKLAQFEPAAFHTFVETEGFYYYWWANRISFNWGYAEEYRGSKDLLRGYAYGIKQYPFVKILREEYQ